jgi:hypothetical protein
LEVVKLPGKFERGFLVYLKYPYYMLALMREASPAADEKDVIRVNRKALTVKGSAFFADGTQPPLHPASFCELFVT